jgi:hypothetical protein
MGAGMRGTIFVLFAAVVLAGSAHAQVHYSCDDPVGAIQTCRDSEGGLYTVMHDAMGAMITDNHGRMSRVQTDPLGDTTIQSQDGSRVRSHTDAFGNTTYEDDQGRQTHCRRSPIAMPGRTEVDCQ